MLSVIITSLNESDYVLNRTIESILKAQDIDLEIIVIDDCSDREVVIEQELKDKVYIHRNPIRMGVAQSRHIGATLANREWILFTDAHMIFHPFFYANFKEHAKTSKPDTVYNGACIGLWSENIIDYTNINLNNLPHYYGASLMLYNEKENQILEGKWNPISNNDNNYKISCLMGAVYFIKKDFFFKIRGLSDLKMWGSDEPCLSLKTMLCGGEIRQLKDVKAAHIFRPSAPYHTYTKYLIYNKIRMLATLLPENVASSLIHKMKKDETFYAALSLIENENKIIEEYRDYYKSIFIKDFSTICQENNIEYPHE